MLLQYPFSSHLCVFREHSFMSKNLIKIEMSRLRQIKVAIDLFSCKFFSYYRPRDILKRISIFHDLCVTTQMQRLKLGRRVSPRDLHWKNKMHKLRRSYSPHTKGCIIYVLQQLRNGLAGNNFAYPCTSFHFQCSPRDTRNCKTLWCCYR